MAAHDPTSRLEDARLRQKVARDRIEALATDSIMSWLVVTMRRVVGRVVHAVVDWFSRLFAKSAT
jgi:hypothetical protein